MKSNSAVGAYFQSVLPTLDTLPRSSEGFALPDASLECLKALVHELEVTQVFEFGSGCSTRLFLQCGCGVTSLEDSEKWLAQTASTLAPDYRSRWYSEYHSLKKLWHRGVPFDGWELTSAMKERLSRADLVLIDSPVFPPFREYAVIQALTHADRAVLVVDDANIPTVARYCHRLAVESKAIWRHAKCDHGLFFIGPKAAIPSGRRSLAESLKGWRRYQIRNQFLG